MRLTEIIGIAPSSRSLWVAKRDEIADHTRSLATVIIK
jgi:hypothetical protein